MNDGPIKIIFVCLGNIVRSPLAENYFRHLVNQAGVEEEYHIDSAGIGDWHIGDSPDSRMRRVAAQHGLVYDGRARQIKSADLREFDLIIAMDLDNELALRRMAASSQIEAKIHLLREFDPQAGTKAIVPDPYYGGLDGFEEVYRIIERSCQGLFTALQTGDINR